jgi:phospholipase/carboxylesterase
MSLERAKVANLLPIDYHKYMLDGDQFTHYYVDNKAKKTLFLLHGTGGTEKDFLFLDEMLDKKYNLVGLRGAVIENGMSRFFHRSSEGVFDQDSIRQEAGRLSAFITSWVDIHNLDPKNIVFFGYSNGANMILASIFLYPQQIQTAVLLHPMLPMEPAPGLNLSQKKFFVSFATMDIMVAREASLKVIETLKSHRAGVTSHEYQGSHEISELELSDVIDFLF